MADARILARVAKFKEDLRARSHSSVVRRHITFGDCYILDSDQEFDLREAVAARFDLHPNDIFVVGSAKLGFSIAPHKRFRPFANRSDIDLAVISPALFDQLWEAAFLYRASVGFWDKEQDFVRYLSQGWIRPDKLPTGPFFPQSDDWFGFFRTLSSSGRFGRYKIAAGIYRSHFFFENYQLASVAGCHTEITRV